MPIPNGFVLVDPPPRWLVEWCASTFPERKIEEVYETPDGKKLRFVWSGGERRQKPKPAAATKAPVPAPKAKKNVGEERDLFERRKR